MKDKIEVGIVVPTMGTRVEYLRECLESIAIAGEAFVVLVTPRVREFQHFVFEGLVDLIVMDPKSGLVAAINSGFESMPKSVKYGNWLGDDDTLTKGSLLRSHSALINKNSTFVYGNCLYVDEFGEKIGMNKSGKLASKILSFGPDLIPQPGALFSLKLFQELGGLDSKYRYAFDYDLFLKLKKKGDPIFVNRTQASFRWHSDSLSVKDRKKSVIEAFRVRQSWRSLPSQIIHAPLELFVVSATYMAGLMLRRRAISNKAIGLH